MARRPPPIAICVATYRRPALLGALLDSLSNTRPQAFRVIVVDNDPKGSGRIVARSSDLDLEYVIETKPGIAAARNAALEHLRPTDEFIVFVDDDERVSTNWLAELLRTQQQTAADVVAGPVISVFDPSAPAWIVAGGFIQRARFPTGAPVRSPATNNTLVRTAFLRNLGSPKFDESFSLSGGSDTEFFRRLRLADARMIWCDEAPVYENVPQDRANFSWIWRRGVREGNVSGRLRLLEVSRIRLLIAGTSRIVWGGIRVLADFAAGRGLRATSVAYLTRGVGWIGASVGRLVMEYARPADKNLRGQQTNQRIVTE